MPNYGLVVNSTFQPFSYQELAAPLDRQELYHEKLAEEYDKLSSQADVLEAMGSNDRDKNSGTYARYKAYSDNLRKEADDLYRFGLNSESRQRLSDLRRMYNTEIVPIQNAWNKREKEADDQMKAQLQNPSLMFTRDARNTTLDDYVRNPTGGYGVINGANITAQMAGMAKNLAKQIRSGNRQNIDDYTYNYIEKYGLDENLIRNWQDSPTLSAMFKQVMESNGVTPEALDGSANMQSIMDKSAGYAEMGMWNAMGEDKSHTVENYEARLDAQAAKEIAVAQAKEAAKNGGIGEGGMPNIPSVAVGLTPTDEYAAKNLEVLNSLKTGHDALKSSYFGRNLGQVNPMKIYQEYQDERKKHTRDVVRVSPGHPGGAVERVEDTNSAKKAILDKYRKYGVTDILSDEQYNALSSLGYSEKNNITSTRHSKLLSDFNRTVEQKSRYSTNMSDYEAFNDKAIPSLMSRDRYNNGTGTVWEIGKDGKLGKPASVKDMNLYSKDNTKGNKIADVQYDPEFKSKIVLMLDDGSLYVTDPNVYDANLARMIQDAERAGAPAQAITARIYDFLNKKNKVQGKTDSKLE